jgi:ligand-binding sensor domain-containing protein
MASGANVQSAAPMTSRSSVSRAPRRSAAMAAALALLLLCARHADALDPSRTLTQYVHRIWQVQQGLPQAAIYSIVQTHDGYVWLGTQTGLVQFEGVRFTTIDQMGGLPRANTWITNLAEDDDGALWIGTTQSGLLELRNGRVTRYGQPDGLPAGSVQCLFDDRHGHLFVCTPNGLAEKTGSKFRVYGVADGLSSPDVHAASSRARCRCQIPKRSRRCCAPTTARSGSARAPA